jgi:mono/diheme cytochrome c family protein
MTGGLVRRLRVTGWRVGPPLTRASGAAGVLLGALLSASAAWAGDWEALVADGERWWSRSPALDQPVACATCHHDPEAIRGWAGSFPKVRPMPPPHTRVMTLLQATTEAVARHYGPRDPRPAAVAISAFLVTRGVGLPITPGVTPDQPIFPTRMRALAESVERGRRLYARRCGACHVAARIAPRAGGFLRTTAKPVEIFVEGHQPAGSPISWNSPGMADLLAYLLAHRMGEPVTAGAPPEMQEASR